MYDKGLLLTKTPLEPLSGSESDVEFRQEKPKSSKKEKRKKKTKSFI